MLLEKQGQVRKTSRKLEVTMTFYVPLHSGSSPKSAEIVVVKDPAKSIRNSHDRLNEFVILL